MKHVKVWLIASLMLVSGLSFAETADIASVSDSYVPNDDLDTCWVAPEWRD